jgi:hypothetical protein
MVVPEAQLEGNDQRRRLGCQVSWREIFIDRRFVNRNRFKTPILVAQLRATRMGT